jgi:hypothetical protein
VFGALSSSRPLARHGSPSSNHVSIIFGFL